MKDINSETDFENHIRLIIQEDILTDNSDLILLSNKKAVDILLCRNNSNPTLFFIEIKYYKHNHGRLGFGHGKGGGIQPEILLKRPDFFETNLKWIIGSEESEDYYLVDISKLRNYVMGKGIADKFNNIKKSLFKDEIGIDRQQLVTELRSWMKE